MAPSTSDDANTLSQHLGLASDQKESIGRWAGGQIASGESILLDGGSTVRAIIPWLNSLEKLTLTTPDLETLSRLAPLKSVEVNCLGGRLPNSGTTFEGPVTEAALEGLRFDKVFLSAAALTPEDGLFSETQTKSWLKELMARRGGSVFVLVDSTKLGPKHFPACRRLSVPWTLVTDSAADPVLLDQFRCAGVPVQVVPAQPLTGGGADFTKQQQLTSGVDT